MEKNITNSVLVIKSELQKWREAEKSLSADQIKLINKLIDLNERLSKAGVSYNLLSKSLPTVQKEKATDEIAMPKPNVMFPVEISGNNRWDIARSTFPSKTIDMLEEFFDLIEELKSQGLKYSVSPSSALGAGLPLEKEGIERNPIVLL